MIAPDEARELLRAALMEHTPDNVGASRVERILGDVWPTVEAQLFTGMSVGTGADDMHPETWAERCARQDTELARLRPLAQLLQDLDRCEHGRHEGDNCWGCGGPSKGNPVVRVANGVGLDYVQALRDTGSRRTIGFRYDATPIVVPEQDARSNTADAWRAAS